MTRAFLNLFLVLSLALAPLHHVLAAQFSSSSSTGCADMNHHSGHMQAAADAGHVDGSDDGDGHADGLCNGCASCTHCSAALNPFTMAPVVSGTIHHPEQRATLRSIDFHPDLRPPRLS